MLQLRKAERKNAKVRIGLSSVSGGGKTYSSLLIGKGLAKGDYSKVAIIDTENGSADLYSDLGEYNVLSIQAPFSPEKYVDAIKVCENAGMEVIIIDSISHEWEGEGGVISLADTLGGGFQNAWKQLTPRHEKFKQAILQSKCHTITTARRKQDYIIQERANRSGKMVQTPVKAGFKEVTREGWEYELTVNLELELNHHATASKDRTKLFMDKDPFIITEQTGVDILAWCESGANVEPVDYAPSLRSATTLEELKSAWEAIPTIEDKTKFQSVKDEVKEKLTQKSTPTEQQEMEPAEKSLRSAKGLDELAEAFKKLSPADKKKWKDLKDELKGKLPEKMEEAA